MNELTLSYFSKLTQNRAKAAEAIEGFALSGVKKSVVEKYTDQAHFIYELLQNADDAKATAARFILRSDRLMFAHNGTRRFSLSDPATEEQDQENGTLGDINAISAVGGSNKNDSATIGKFGIGFKAVFQYTATPHIYDPDVFFKIERLIVPILLSSDDAERRSDETLFVFPFDHDKRSAKEAFEDISEKLRSLEYPLLFLTNLKDIEFDISGTIGLYGKVVDESQEFGNTIAELIRLTQNDGENHEELYDSVLWLFTRKSKKGQRYSVGFFLDEEGHLIPKFQTAFCFFPTKVFTGLNFIIHAPFLLTDNREGIYAGDQYNISMISLLAELASDSLVYLKLLGQSKSLQFIDDNIFDIIPYDESKFGDVASKNIISFKPFFTKMKEAFLSHAIVPTANGNIKADNAYWAAVPQVAELFSDEQLARLVRNENAKWVFTSFGRQDTLRRNKALTEYIDSITSVWLDEDDILNGWSLGNGEKYDGITASFIEEQSIEWLHNFYKWIADTKGRTDQIKARPIFLDQNGNAVAAFDDDDHEILFLPTDDGHGYTTVNELLLQNKDTAAFIKQIGVSEPSLRDEIYNIILKEYEENVAIDTRPHFKKFFRYYQTCSQTEARDLLALIREYEFVLYSSIDDETQYRGRASSLYFPFDSLLKWFEPKPETRFVSFDDYIELVGIDNRELLRSFLADLGVCDTPRIISRDLEHYEAMKIQPLWPRSSRNPKWTESELDGFSELMDVIVENQRADLSTLLWSQLLKCVESGKLKEGYEWSRNNILYGHYDYFYYNPSSKAFDSSVSKRLRTKPWILNANGDFVSAEELSIQNMNTQYDITSFAALELLKILGIQDKAIDQPEDANEDITSYGERLGLSEEEQRLALLEYARRKVTSDETQDTETDDDDDDDDDHEEGKVNPGINRPSVKRVGKEITKRATTTLKVRNTADQDTAEDAPSDEDEYSKPTVDIASKIEKVKEQAEREILEIARLEDLKTQAQNADKYSYGWFKSLLELESLNSGDSVTSREISISFAKVERETGTSKILILKHPSRYIPQFMEDLADIPLELHSASQPTIKVAIEVVNVKSYTLRVKLRTNAEIDGIDLTQVTEARIVARNPVFLLEELRRAFERLGEDNEYNDNFDMQSNLCENIEFVFGPPGTGKTTHLAREIILPLMQSPKELKVLVLTPTNKSADVLVRRIMEIMGADHGYLNWLVRFGGTNDSTIEQSGVFREKTFDIRSFKRNVTVTTIARFPYDFFLPDVNTRLHLNELKWDYIIFDEASMIPIANIIYPLYKKTPEKFIVAGDPFQIEPITTVDMWKNENIYTMVELSSFTETKTVPHDYPVALLTTQYRSIPAIGEVFSRFAYGGVLKHYRSTDSQRALPIGDFLDLQPVTIIKFPVSKFESIYRPKRLQNKTPYQVYSALFAFEFVRYLASLIELTKGNEEFRIGLIAPYRAQADLIDKLMTSAPLPKNIDVQVGTIHGFQGDECDIIIALFNPPPKITTHRDMFLNRLNIINVSISRARDYLIVLMPDDETDSIDNLKLIKRVERLCKEQPAWSEESSPLIEERMFGSRTYLEDNSFSTSHQLVNVYGKPEKRYEIRSEDNAVDVQIHE